MGNVPSACGTITPFMARKRISEYKAKSLLFESLGLPYRGIRVTTSSLSPLENLKSTKTYVVKVDQGVKKRFKLGLISLDISSDNVQTELKKLAEKGYSQFIVEEYKEHAASQEKYLSFQRSREGLVAYTSDKGGVDIEEDQDSVSKYILSKVSPSEVAKSIGVPPTLIEKIVSAMDQLHFSFVEINPLVIDNDQVLFLDLAVEVDTAGAFFVKNAWSQEDFVEEVGGKTEEEKEVEKLSDKSQASFRLVVLNPNGSIFMLLSGGGASIVLADEVYNKGLGKELANYGEYSGNPNAEETYLYTKQLLSLLLKSNAKRKVLIIAGGVANFTDIRITFKGVIQALEEVKAVLRKQGVTIFVRRGGPYQEEGLATIKAFLEKVGLPGQVSGPQLLLTDVVVQALKEVQQ